MLCFPSVRSIPRVVIFMIVFSAATSGTPAGSPVQHGWRLTWSDEFNGRDGTAPDPAKWKAIVGGGSGEELEYYTDRPENVHLEHGNLVLTARKEDYRSPYGRKAGYTSGRVETRGKFEQKYGRFEARIKLPKGQGIWPAFWMLGANMSGPGSGFDSVKWPACGEIDIMESIGRLPSTVFGTLHGPNYLGGEVQGKYELPARHAFSEDFHLFAIEWEPAVVRFYVDEHLYATETPQTLPAGDRWIFDHPYYLILNLAVGGHWPGPPDATTGFPQQMLVDYVRVYSAQ